MNPGVGLSNGSSQVFFFFLSFWFILTCEAQLHYADKGRNKNPWALGLHFRRQVDHETVPPATPVCITDLNCYVCSEENDMRCGLPDTPMEFLKSCKTLIPCTSDSFGTQDCHNSSPDNLSKSYLCYKTYDPYTRKQSRSCQTTGSLPEWDSASSNTGCTTSRLMNPAGKIGTRCICNTNACNGGSIFIPPNDYYSKGYPKSSTPFLIAFLYGLNLIK